MNGRPLARLVVCLAILVLGGVSAWRLELAYPPSWNFPELRVRLDLPETGEVGETTRLYVQPLESAIRAVGGVTSTAGWVDASRASFTVRFRAGTDPERKAARLESELAVLRRRLPRGTRLDVWSAVRGGGDVSVLLWIERSSGGPMERGLVDAVRALAEVRDVEVDGEDLRELQLTAKPGGDPAALTRAFDEGLGVRRLGETTVDGRRHSVLLRSARDTPLGGLPVRRGEVLLPLASLAEIDLAEVDAPIYVRRQGERGLGLLVRRDDGSSPLALERALRGVLERFGLAERSRFLFSEAEPLRRLLQRLVLGFLAAIGATALLAGILGGWRAAACQALALPVALAAALVAFWLAGLWLDVTTLPMLAVALGWCLFYLAFRQGRQALRLPLSPWERGPGGEGSAAVVVAASAALLPIAVALAGGRLTALFQAPTRAFLWAQLAGVAALAVVPLPGLGGRILGTTARNRIAPAAVGRPLRAALRNPWTVLLGTVTGVYALLVLFGSALEPRPGDLSPVTADLRVGLRFLPATPPRQAEAQVALAERELARREEVVEHWSWFTDRGAVINATVRREDRSPEDLARLAGRLQIALDSLGSTARVVPLAAGANADDEPVRFSDSLEDRAETDAGASFYRFILRSTDLDVLEKAHTRIVQRITQVPGIGREAVSSDWGRPGTRLELVARPGATPPEIEAAFQVLRRRASLPVAHELLSASDVRLRVLDPDAPRTRDDVPQRADVLGLQRRKALAEEGSPLVPGDVFDVREVISSPTVRRQSGRFVLPVTVRFYTFLRQYEDRATIDRNLRFFPVPAGCDLELPDLRPDVFSPERRRMLAIAATLPMLLWALASIRLNSAWRGLVALAPLVVGVAAATPWIRAARGHVDEVTLFALGAMAVGGAPLAFETLAAARASKTGGRDAPGQDYRWLARHALVFLVAAVGMVLLLAVPGAGIDADRHPWAMPMGVAAVSGAATVLASVFCLPGLLRAAAHWRERGAGRERRRSTAAAWRSPGVLELETRRLVKVYGDGFAALRGLDCRLGPGIIGLLGPNGAGKTTLLRTLCGLLEPTRGRVLYRGVAITPENLPEYRRLVGFLPQDFNAYAGFTGAQFLDYWALEKGLRDPGERRREIERQLALVGLEDAAGRKVRDYSGGMRRRIGIARALLGDPPIVIVDEPTTGLDVASRNRLRESLLKVSGERVILFSTHLASDVAAAAARVLLLLDGRLLYDGPAGGLVEKARGAVFEAVVGDAELREFSHRYRVTTRVRTLDGIRVRAVVEEGQEPPGRIVEPNLEEAYLAVIGSHRGKRERGRPAGSLLDLERWRREA